MNVQIEDSIEPLATEWELLAQQTKVSPFLRPGWFDAWWRAFGAGRLQILAVYESGRLAGVLPLRWFRGVLTSVTNTESTLFGLVAANNTAAKRLSDAVFSVKARHIGLDLLTPTDAGSSFIRAGAEAAHYHVLTKSIQSAPYVATTGSWDAYESGLRRKFRSELRRRRRRLLEEGKLSLDIYDGMEGLDALLEEGFRIEGLGWKDAYRTSINSHLAARRFYTEVAQWAAEHGWLRLAFLRLNGRTLAFDYCLESNKTHYLLKTGFDPAYQKYAPGMIIRHMMLARAFSEGISRYDFLGINDEWKREWASAQQERLFLHMFAPTVPGLLDQAAFTTREAISQLGRTLIQSSVVSERSRRVLRRWYAMLRARRLR